MQKTPLFYLLWQGGGQESPLTKYPEQNVIFRNTKEIKIMN